MPTRPSTSSPRRSATPTARVALLSRPRVQGRRPPRAHRVAARQPRRRHLRGHVRLHAASAAGSPFQWGQEDYVEQLLGDAYELSFQELDTRHDCGDVGGGGSFFRVELRPVARARSSSTRRPKCARRDDDGGSFEKSTATATESHGAPVHLVVTGAAVVALPGPSRGTRAPARGASAPPLSGRPLSAKRCRSPG